MAHKTATVAVWVIGGDSSVDVSYDRRSGGWNLVAESVVAADGES